jgi:hypothetical protein
MTSLILPFVVTKIKIIVRKLNYLKSDELFKISILSLPRYFQEEDDIKIECKANLLGNQFLPSPVTF